VRAATINTTCTTKLKVARPLVMLIPNSFES
jgi:hypothetical protein